MTYLLGTSPVEEFEAWRAAFHDNETYREDHGERGYQVFRSAVDPNEVVVLFEWDDGEDPRAFFESEEMQARMADAGLTGPPETTVLEFVEEKAAKRPSA